MKLRGLAVLGMIVVAAAMERFAYFGSRSFLSFELRAEGKSISELGTIFLLTQVVTLVGMLVGGAAALGLGPRATFAGGALVAAIGHLALVAGAPVLLGTSLFAFGGGMLRPCPAAAAAETLAWDDEGPAAPGPHRFAAVAAFTVLVYAAINMGSVLSTAIEAQLYERGGARLVHGLNGGVMIFATIIAALAALIHFLGRPGRAGAAAAVGPYRAPEARPAPAPVSTGAAVVGLALLIIPEAAYLGGMSVSTPPYQLLTSATTRSWLFGVNPITVVIASMVVFLVLLLAAIQRSSLPPLVLYGAGLVVFALGLVPIGIAGGSSVGIYVVGAIITAAGEAMAGAVPLAYAAIAVRGRAATLVVAAWSGAGLIISMVSSGLGGVEMLRTPLLWLSALLCLGAGAGIVTQGKALHQTYFDPPTPPPQPNLYGRP